MIAAVCCGGVRKYRRLDRDIVERQYFAPVFKEGRPILDDGPCDSIKIPHFVRLQIVQDLLKPIDETAFLLSGIHIC